MSNLCMLQNKRVSAGESDLFTYNVTCRDHDLYIDLRMIGQLWMSDSYDYWLCNVFHYINGAYIAIYYISWELKTRE